MTLSTTYKYLYHIHPLLQIFCAWQTSEKCLLAFCLSSKNEINQSINILLFAGKNNTHNEDETLK